MAMLKAHGMMRMRQICHNLQKTKNQVALCSTGAVEDRSTKMKTKAVIFDMGGVLVPTALHVWTGNVLHHLFLIKK